MMSKWMLLVLALSGVCRADQVSGTVQVGSYPALSFVDGWVSESSGRFVSMVLVPYRSPQHKLDTTRPYAMLTAWWDGKPQLSHLKMANLYVFGVPKPSESGDATAKYTFDRPAATQSVLRRWEQAGKSLHFATRMKDCTSPYPDTPLGTWQLEGTLTIP